MEKKNNILYKELNLVFVYIFIFLVGIGIVLFMTDYINKEIQDLNSNIMTIKD